MHRDLKPENVFVTRDGRIKILDFGLAKLTEGQDAYAAASVLATSPVMTTPGVVLGTVGYMAPEQVRGAVVDYRADLFAFGAVLYEMLSGRRPFSRATAPETMAAILNEDPPDLAAAQVPVAPGLARVVNRCLEKEPAERFQSASDLAFALAGCKETSSIGPASARTGKSWARAWWAGWVAAALVLALLAPVAYLRSRDRPSAAAPVRFQIAPTIEFGGPGNFGLSPDGRRLAFVGQGPDGIPRIWIRTMDSLAVQPLAGSETIPVTPPPFWSPDGRFVAFQVDNKLKKIDVAGGVPQTLGDLPGVAVGGSWNRTGDLLVGNTSGGILHERESGGPMSAVTVVDPSQKEEAHMLPSFLPDGRHFLYLRKSPDVPEATGIYVGTLDRKPEDQHTRRLLPYVVGPAYVPGANGGQGWLLYLREGTLMAQAFDADRLELAGSPVAVAERVASFRDSGSFAASANDVLVYRSAEVDSRLTWYDQQGNVTGSASEPAPFRSVALSPDGTRAVVSRTSQQDATKADLWLLDLSRGNAATRLTLGAGVSEYPLWSRDGQRIVFTFNNHTIRQMSANGAGEEKELLRSSSVSLVVANDWSLDARSLLYSGYAISAGGVGNLDLGVLSLDGVPRPLPFIRTDFNEEQGRFSPNARLVAYVSNQSGANEVYVRQVVGDIGAGATSLGGSVLLSRGGGTAPRWRGDGRELFYLAPNGKMMTVDVSAEPSLRLGIPSELFQTPPGTLVGDVSRDGKRFLFITPTGPSASVFTVVLNWAASLKK